MLIRQYCRKSYYFQILHLKKEALGVDVKQFVNIFFENTIKAHHWHEVTESVIVTRATVFMKASLQTQVVGQQELIGITFGDQFLKLMDARHIGFKRIWSSGRCAASAGSFPK